MDLIDPHNVEEIFFDGIHDVRIIEDVVRAVLFSNQNASAVIVKRVIIPVARLPDVIQALVIALTEAAKRAAKHDNGH